MENSYTAPKPKLERRFIILIIAAIIATTLAIISLFFRPNPTATNSAKNANARIFFNYLITGREQDTALPAYREDLVSYIESMTAGNSRENAITYVNHAIELDDKFIQDINLDGLDETIADFITNQRDDLTFLKFYLENPAPNLRQIIETDQITNQQILKNYAVISFEDETETILPASVKSYLDKLYALDSTYATNYAMDYEISTKYDLYEAAKKLQSGCAKYDCTTKITNDDFIDTELIDEAYRDYLNTPIVTATAIAASSYDIIEGLEK